ncbi:MAG: MurR/RpiR family transcriptional regulator [Lachnospiraceae bacterium]|nr:MurR/RpiR family transcriptional regulator [Lachnospiraceae bacterium]MDE6620243.1 MurR/RpiR family transcriptional regulator [Lachnospiraceae bacterium]
MIGNILELITEQYHSLTRSSRKLADFILANSHDAQYMSISSLAESSGVSEASITRFCRSLGLSGYNNLKLALAKAAYVTDIGDPSDTPDTITSEDTLGSIFHKLYDSNVLSLNETMELLDETEISRAVDLLSAADRVFCLGNGGSMVMAMEAWARFSIATSRFVHIEDSHMQVMNISLASEKDVILFFSYSGSTKDMEDIMRIARERHVSVILVTHFPNSRATKYADVVLLCGYNESPLQSGSVAAKLGQLFIIECLFYVFCKRNPEVYSKARSSTAEAIMPKLL